MTTNTIPGVRDQVRRWASGRSAKDADESPRETLTARELKILGRVGRSTFAIAPDGRHLRLKGPVMPYAVDQAPADAIVVLQSARAADGRQRADTYIATVVEAGSYERLQRRKEYRPKERHAGPIDGLAELRKPADRIPVRLAPDDDSPVGIIKGALSKRPMLLWTDSRSSPRTVRRLIEMANADGANLRHYQGHTLADWTHTGRWRPLLVAAWPLIDAHLAGTPLRCAFEHEQAPLADTLDPAGVPVCNSCVGWEPAAQ